MYQRKIENNMKDIDKRLDIENPEVFGQFEFMDACQAMGIIKDLDYKAKLIIGTK